VHFSQQDPPRSVDAGDLLQIDSTCLLERGAKRQTFAVSATHGPASLPIGPGAKPSWFPEL